MRRGPRGGARRTPKEERLKEFDGTARSRELKREEIDIRSYTYIHHLVPNTRVLQPAVPHVHTKILKSAVPRICCCKLDSFYPSSSQELNFTQGHNPKTLHLCQQSTATSKKIPKLQDRALTNRRRSQEGGRETSYVNLFSL